MRPGPCPAGGGVSVASQGLLNRARPPARTPKNGDGVRVCHLQARQCFPRLPQVSSVRAGRVRNGIFCGVISAGWSGSCIFRLLRILVKVPDGSAKSYLANRGPVYFLVFFARSSREANASVASGIA